MGVGMTLDPLFSTPDGILLPIAVVDKLASDSSTNFKALGVLRQMRFGPLCINKIAIYNNIPALEAYAASTGYNTSRFGLYFDTVP
jgi:hypothetical protein